MKINMLRNFFRFSISWLVIMTLFTVNAGCEENTAPAVKEEMPAGPERVVQVQNVPDKAVAGTSIPEWDPAVWMQEFRREMYSSFADRYDPWGEFFHHEDEPFRWLQEMQDEMDHFFERSRSRWKPAEAAGLEMVWTPQVDIYEDDNNVVVRVDLPGMDKEGIEITVTGNILTLKGEKKEEKEIKKEDYQRWERSYGSFQRSIMLPPYADTGKADSSYENGVLEIKFPKKATPVKQRISLN